MSNQVSPKVKLEDIQTTVLAAATEKYPRNMGGDLIRLQDGRLFLSYSQWLTGVTDADSSRLVGRISNDDGESWGDVFVVAEPNEHCDSVRMPSLIRLGDGRLALFTRCHQTMSKKWVAMMVCRDESLEMLTAPAWTKLNRISPPDTGAQVIISKRVIRTSQGRIIVPVAAPWPWDRRDDKTDNIRSFCLLSDDDGVTWRVSSSVLGGPGRGMMEPCVIELDIGKMMMLIRTQMHRQYVSYSDDGGDVWTPAKEVNGLVSPESPAALARMPDIGWIVVVWNQNRNVGRPYENRTPLTVGFSADEGKSWFGIQDLEEGADKTWSYPSISFLGGRAHVLYYDRTGRGSSHSPISLKMSRFCIRT